MKTLTDQLEQLAELQKNNLEPARQLNHAAFDAFERIARKNYELMGDMVEYAVSQSRGQLEAGTPQERLERQMADAKVLAERIGMRAHEYAELVSTMRDEAISGGARVMDKAEVSAKEANSRTVAAAEQAASTVAPAAVDKGAAGRSGTADSSAPPKAGVTAKKAAKASGTAASKVVTKKSAAKKGAAKKSSAAKTSGKKAASKRGGKRA